jgi:multiple sugar transport system substrate-binding protein
MKSSPVSLCGITWNHTRGYLPMVATAQRFMELNPEVTIQWDVRSLQEFADFSVEDLALRYDLLVIDHPCCGMAAAKDTLLPLDEWIPADFIADQAANSVGRSHDSYRYAGHQWALATDAATPIAGWRPGLLEKAKAQVPRTWPELVELARRGLVIIPAVPIDSLMHFYMLCGAAGEELFQREAEVVSEEVGVTALRMLHELTSLCDPECLGRDPIATWQLLASGETAAYCPFAYGYSNYSRRGYGQHVLDVGGLIKTEHGPSFRSTLGGAGLAISSACREPETAARYLHFVADAGCQSTLYFDSGGQPGYRGAWLNSEVNRRSNNFFTNTLPTLDAAFVRPRFDGYLEFQDAAGALVHRYLANGLSEKDVMMELNAILRKSSSHREHAQI